MTEDRLYLVTLQKLRIFAAVAHERSFARAAYAMHLQSPTISEEVKSLENIVGLRLLYRSRGRRLIELTEAGEILLRSYDEVFQSLTEAGKALNAIKRIGRGTVAFGADVMFGTYLLPVVYDTFCRTHPGISVHVEVDHRLHILDSLARGRLDIAVTLGPNEEAGLVKDPLIPCYMVPIGPVGHRLAQPTPAPFKELARERLLLVDRSTYLRRALERMADEEGTSLNVVMELGTISALLQAVLHGLGVTVLSTLTAAAELPSGRLCVLHIQGFPIIMEWFIVHPPHQLSPSAQALKAHLLHLRDTLKELSFHPCPT